MNTGWSGEDVRGFSKIFGNQTAIWNAIQKENSLPDGFRSAKPSAKTQQAGKS